MCILCRKGIWIWKRKLVGGRHDKIARSIQMENEINCLLCFNGNKNSTMRASLYEWYVWHFKNFTQKSALHEFTKFQGISQNTFVKCSTVWNNVALGKQIVLCHNARFSVHLFFNIEFLKKASQGVFCWKFLSMEFRWMEYSRPDRQKSISYRQFICVDLLELQSFSFRKCSHGVKYCEFLQGTLIPQDYPISYTFAKFHWYEKKTSYENLSTTLEAKHKKWFQVLHNDCILKYYLPT